MPRKAKRTDDAEQVYAMAAAYLRSQGRRQSEIAVSLGVSQPEVSRLLGKAAKARWLGHPVFNPALARPIWEKAQALFFSQTDVADRLRKLCPGGKSHLTRVTRVPSLQGTDDPQEFSPPIVDVMQALFARVRIVGVTWGGTLSRLVAVLDQHRARLLRRDDPILFVPLCGEPLKDRDDPVSYSSSALAGKLSEIFNGPGCKPPPSLAGVPIFIPIRFDRRKVISQKEFDTIRRFICQVAGYAEVFGNEFVAQESRPEDRPLVDRVELILTSVGVVPAGSRVEEDAGRLGTFLKERVDLGDLTDGELGQWIVGDIGGVMIGHDRLGKSATRRIRDMNHRWTGIQVDHLVRCARAAAKQRMPGVVVLATGKGRRQIVERCVRHNLVNELVIDEELERALKKGLDDTPAAE